MSYITPVDKAYIPFTYATRAQARFERPFCDCAELVDLNAVDECAKYNLRPSTSSSSDRRAIRQALVSGGGNINAKSDRIRRRVALLEPATRELLRRPGASGRSTKLDPCPASELLWAKAGGIVKTVCGDVSPPARQQDVVERRTPVEEESVAVEGEFFKRSAGRRPYFYTTKYQRASIRDPTRLLAVGAKNPTTVLPVMPSDIKSPYLEEEHNQAIWEWLADDMRISAFEYFVSICG